MPRRRPLPTPADSDIGNLQLCITATDPAGASASQLFSLEVTSDNDPQHPVTESDTAEVPEDNILTGNVLANDNNTGEVTSFQIDGDPTVYTVGDTVIFTEGTLTLAGNGDYNFTPTQDYAGQVPQVTYTTSSGSSCTLNITVTPVSGASSKRFHQSKQPSANTTRLAGKRAVKQLPWPIWLVISSCAWWRFSECLTMARPSPVPPASRERPRSTR